MSRFIDFGEHDHVTVLGQTQSGKTYGTMKTLSKSKRGVFFFNTQQIQFPSGWIQATKADDEQAIIGALRSGEKVVYHPSREYRQQELEVLTNRFYHAAEQSVLDIYYVMDEIHLFKGKALDAAVEVATTGLRWGMKAVYISQRPAKVHNDLMTQCTKFVFFDINEMEGNYMKNYRIPFESIHAGLKQGGKYAYVEFKNGVVDGPYKVS